MKTMQRLFIGIAAVAALVMTMPSHAAEQDTQKISKPKYSQLDLREKLSNTPLIPTSKADETIAFTVNVDAEGSVASMTYTHNITTESDAVVRSYIRDAYKAIMDTEFEPAKQNGKPVASSVTIQFYINS